MGKRRGDHPARFQRVGLNGETATDFRAYMEGVHTPPGRIWPRTPRAFQIALRKAALEALGLAGADVYWASFRG